MELVLQIGSPEAFSAALEAGVGGVAVRLPLNPGPDWWDEAGVWQTAARRRNVRFYLVWDGLIEQPDLDPAEEILARAAELRPDALVLRDMGLVREARRRYPGLSLHASGAWGCQNSLGLGLAQTLGFRQVVLDAPLSLKDLALMRRQSQMPVEAVVPASPWGFSGLCLVQEYLGMEAAFQLARAISPSPAQTMPGALENLASLLQLGVEAVQVGWEFTRGESLRQVVKLCRLLWEASPAARPGVLDAAREVLAAFGELVAEGAGADPISPKHDSGARNKGRRPGPPDKPQKAIPAKDIWLEARDYTEAAALARDWRGVLVVSLTPENYGAFLPEHRRWKPRLLVWRLPPVIRESALTFYLKALETLRQGGYLRFIAADWGAAALARRLGAEVYGEQTLGVRNVWALKAARELGVARICLPPGDPDRWRDLLKPEAGFWGYLSHYPALGVWPRGAEPALPRTLAGYKLRRVVEGELALLCKRVPENLEPQTGLLQSRGVAPLVVALPRSGLPMNRVPVELELRRPQAPRPFRK
jgi:collagenase-like PrtC family protease